MYALHIWMSTFGTFSKKGNLQFVIMFFNTLIEISNFILKLIWSRFEEFFDFMILEGTFKGNSNVLRLGFENLKFGPLFSVLTEKISEQKQCYRHSVFNEPILKVCFIIWKILDFVSLYLIGKP